MNSGYFDESNKSITGNGNNNNDDEDITWNNNWNDDESISCAFESQRILDNTQGGDQEMENDVPTNMESKTLSNLHTYKIAGAALIIALVSFTVNTVSNRCRELTYNRNLPRRSRKGSIGRNHIACCSIPNSEINLTPRYLHHSSWSLMGPLQFLFIRLTSPANLSTWPLLRSHLHSLRTTAAHIHSESPFAMYPSLSPQKYMFYVIGTLTVTLTIAASTWFLAVSLTSTSDVTAMYNCSAFFAYAFSIPLLGERFRKDKAFAVGLAIMGVFLMAWATNDDSGSIAAHRRFLGDAVCQFFNP